MCTFVGLLDWKLTRFKGSGVLLVFMVRELVYGEQTSSPLDKLLELDKLFELMFSGLLAFF